MLVAYQYEVARPSVDITSNKLWGAVLANIELGRFSLVKDNRGSDQGNTRVIAQVEMINNIDSRRGLYIRAVDVDIFAKQDTTPSGICMEPNFRLSVSQKVNYFDHYTISPQSENVLKREDLLQIPCVGEKVTIGSGKTTKVVTVRGHGLVKRAGIIVTQILLPPDVAKCAQSSHEGWVDLVVAREALNLRPAGRSLLTAKAG